jgi:hypothetical protein
MKQQTIELLYEVITTSLHMSADTQLKFRALEIALEKYEPNLFQAYLKAKEDLKTDGVNRLNVKLLEELRKKLVQFGDSDPTDDETTQALNATLQALAEKLLDDELG